MGNMRFKVGDKVRIKSLDWYNENKDEYGNIDISHDFTFYADRSKYCGKVFTIDVVFDNCYTVKEDNHEYYWADEMIEGLVEEEVGLVDNLSSRWVNEFNLPEGYIFKDENGNVINATKIVLEKKNIIREEQIDNAAQEYLDSDNAVLTYSDGFCEQTDHPFVRAAFKAGVEWADNNVTQDDSSKAPKLTSQDYSNGRFGYQLPAGFEAKLTERELILTPEKSKYPKTYEECCKILGLLNVDLCFNAEYRSFDASKEQWKRLGLMNQFYQLLICRDAYWKIAGEEMGLGEPWKPNDSSGYCTYAILRHTGHIRKSRPCADSALLEFPTEEMRDAFYENFKEEIEICKELL